MKTQIWQISSWLLLAANLALLSDAGAQQSTALRLAQGTNGLQLVQPRMTNQGALFVLGSPNVEDVLDSPSFVWGTNSPLSADQSFSTKNLFGNGNSGF